MKDKEAYICVDHDDSIHEPHDLIYDISEWLDEWNENMGTEYKSIKDFNINEEFRTLYKILRT